MQLSGAFEAQPASFFPQFSAGDKKWATECWPLAKFVQNTNSPRVHPWFKNSQMNRIPGAEILLLISAINCHQL
jgi:hypothetical protein